MSEERTIFWPGVTGAQYRYSIYPVGVSIVPVSGNYIFAKEISPQTWTAIYVGETDNLGELLGNPDNHEKIADIRLYGVTHIHIHNHGFDVDVRRREAMDIRQKCRPPCNSPDQ